MPVQGISARFFNSDEIQWLSENESPMDMRKGTSYHNPTRLERIPDAVIACVWPILHWKRIVAIIPLSS